ncbi:hypothetical protein JCM1841_002322 [Sporobolomyces salmonicolor]
MTVNESPPTISVAAGITVGLVASFVQSLGLTIQRLSHVANERLPPQERKRDWQRPLWLGGFAIFILSNVFGTLFQIGALPIVVLGPLGAVSLLWNAAFARLILGDEFTIHLVLGTVLIAGGATLIGIFGVVPEETHTLEELVRLYRRPPFIVWVSLLAFFLTLVLLIAHLAEWRLNRLLTLLYPPSPSAMSKPSSRPSWRRHIRRWSAPSKSAALHNDLRASLPGLRPGAVAIDSLDSASERTPLLKQTRWAHRVDTLRPKPLALNVESPGDDAAQAVTLSRIKRTRVWVGLAYGATSGTLSGLCLLFTKTGIELLILTIMGQNQFSHIEAWIIIVVLLVCEVFQLSYLNRALRLVGPTLVCPLAFCFYNSSSIASGLIYYNQWDDLSGLQIGLVGLGIVVLLAGVWVVSLKSGTGADKGAGVELRESEDTEAEEPWTDGTFSTEPEPEEDDADQPLDWRPRGFSVGIGAASPGFDVRPTAQHRARRRTSTPPASTPFPSYSNHLDLSDETPVIPPDDDEFASLSRSQRARRGCQSLSGSLYVGSHRRSGSGGSLSLPTMPFPTEGDASADGEAAHGLGIDQGSRLARWWKRMQGRANQDGAR